MRRVLPVAVVLLAVLGFGTYWAGEQTEVAVLRTFGPDGAPHETKLWVVDIDGVPWVRVARPERSWFQRLEANPRVELVRASGTSERRAVPLRDAEALRKIDTTFAAKYGRTDWWYGLLLRSDPVPVRLDAGEAVP